MGHPHKDWQNYMVKTLRKYPEGLRRENTPKAIEAMSAIADAVTETERMVDGMDRIACMDMLYFKNTHTVIGAANMVNVSKSTVERWSRDFIRLCAVKLGYMNKN